MGQNFLQDAAKANAAELAIPVHHVRAAQLQAELNEVIDTMYNLAQQQQPTEHLRPEFERLSALVREEEQKLKSARSTAHFYRGGREDFRYRCTGRC